MSSANVRSLVTNFLTANSGETVIDITGQYEELRVMLSDNGVQPDAPWLGLEFQGDYEEPVSLAADNQQGLYREYGMISFHIVAAARLGVGTSILNRGEILRSLFRGRRLGGLVVDELTLIDTGPGTTLEFESGYISGTFRAMYHYDFTPGA